jgi:cyclopropane fatty-acyl-phospholipid synthase-like methyltransferase
MTYTKSDLTKALSLPQFPRSSTYDPDWVLQNLMGPNVLWLTEALTQVMNLKPGMRVLDMGCGMAVSCIFLAKEFGVHVWATDLWISASDNWKRIQDAGLENQVFPIHAEAHTLPYAEAFFDAAVSLDAYHYFGTDDLYLEYYSKFIKAGGELGIVCPGLKQEFTSDVPKHLQAYWSSELWSFHSPEWWQRHWTKGELVDVTHADMIPDGWQQWLLWHEICQAQSYPFYQPEMDALQADQGKNLGFTRVVAHKK